MAAQEELQRAFTALLARVARLERRMRSPRDPRIPQLSSDHDFELLFDPPHVRVYRTTAQTIAHATETSLKFDAEITDSQGMHDNVTNNDRLTAVVSGWYWVYACIEWVPHATLTRRLLMLLRNDVTAEAAKRIALVEGGAGAQSRLFVGTSVYLKVGDWVRAIVYQESGGGTLNVTVQGTYPDIGAPVFGAFYLASYPTFVDA